MNEKIKSTLNTPEGQLLFCIVKEFLEYFNLQSTMAVFDAESYLGVSYDYKGRSKVSKDLGLKSGDDVPLLQQIVQLAQQKPRTLEVNLNINEENTENVDNNSTSNSNSIKTESSISEDNSDSGTSDVRINKRIVINKEGNGDADSQCNNQNEYNVSLNRTFITESDRLNNSDSLSTCDGQGDILELSNNTQQINISVPLSDKLDEVITPILRDSKISPERVKSPPKSDKYKSKNNLNSLSDLPPLTMNKSLSGKILPSLYNKEFREKPNS